MEDKVSNGLAGSVEAKVSFSKILAEHDISRAQRDKRIELLTSLSSPELNEGQGPHGVVAYLSQRSLDGGDIGILADALLAIGDVTVLTLILESPGGDGTQVEKLVSLCRSQCERFRVIVPNEAKSAATLISLAADEIVMGPSSELGPIDAQIEAIIAGVRRYVSAQSFIDARDGLLKDHAKRKAANEDVEPILQMILTLDLPFIAECEHLMAFGRDVGKKLLCEYMLKAESDKDAKADKIVTELSSVERYKVHGRFINGPMARTMGLNVRICGHDDRLWKTAFEYYQRANIAMSKDGATSIIENKHDFYMAVVPGR
jgi:hypothetical protein